jgi:hypothetical protein
MIKTGLFVAAIAAAGFFAGSVAADSPLSATLQTPLASATEITTEGVIWSCKANGCTAESDTTYTDELDACRGLARRVGIITKFGSLDATKLEKCNRVAKH